jgi:hypothetical protein
MSVTLPTTFEAAAPLPCQDSTRGADDSSKRERFTAVKLLCRAPDERFVEKELLRAVAGGSIGEGDSALISAQQKRHSQVVWASD